MRIERGRRQVALIEITIAVLFFALSSVVILRLYTAAYGKEKEARALTCALGNAQDCADRLRAGQKLEELGFSPDDAQGYSLAGEGYILYAAQDADRLSLVCEIDGEAAFTLPIYRPGGEGA